MAISNMSIAKTTLAMVVATLAMSVAIARLTMITETMAIAIATLDIQKIAGETLAVAVATLWGLVQTGVEN